MMCQRIRSVNRPRELCQRIHSRGRLQIWDHKDVSIYGRSYLEDELDLFRT